MKGKKKAAAAQGRGKRAGFAAHLSFDEALSLKRSIEEGQLSKQRLLKLLDAHHVPCDLYDKACSGKKDNPNCLCGLIPAPGGYRRKGLWQKDPESLACLGNSPLDDKRQACAAPPSLPGTFCCREVRDASQLPLTCFPGRAEHQHALGAQ